MVENHLLEAAGHVGVPWLEMKVIALCVAADTAVLSSITSETVLCEACTGLHATHLFCTFPPAVSFSEPSHVPLTFLPDIVTVFLPLVVTILSEHSCREESECYGLLSSVQL